jgi:phage tail-like protein
MTPPVDDKQSSSYLNDLPAIYQQDAAADTPHFLGRFLLAFEHLLTGLQDVDKPGLEEILDGITDAQGVSVLSGVYRYLEPGPNRGSTQRAPKEFLEWLSGWVALSLRADLDEIHQREFIARAVSLYRQRGTRQGLIDVLGIYTRMGVEIEEFNTSFQIGVSSQIGVNTLLGWGAPHYFQVILQLPDVDPDLMREQRKIATAIIDLEKPAHTYYELTIQTPILQIGVHSQIGVDTLLGAAD